MGVMPTGLRARAQRYRVALLWQRTRPTTFSAASVPAVEWASDPRSSCSSGAADRGWGSADPSPSKPVDERDQQELNGLVAALQCDQRLRQRVAEVIAFERIKSSNHGLSEAAHHVPVPTGGQLWQLHVRTAVPFIGFGFFDNMIMLTVGGAIEATMGVAFGISTLAAAGMGQMVSDASGITLQGLIERFADRLGLPCPGLTDEQRELPMVKSFVLVSRILGIMFGCGIGMFPLLFLPETSKVDLATEIAQALPSARRCEFMNLMTAQQFKEGETILKYGDVSDRVVLVESGQVECVGRDATGLPFKVCIMRPGHSFGHPELHVPANMDLIAKDGPVVMQTISKADFLRVAGSEGMEVWQNSMQRERRVYLATQGHRIDAAVPPARKGSGKTRWFASLSNEEKLEVLKHTSHEGARPFRGEKNEGKVRFFATLPEDTKHKALAEWHKQRLVRNAELVQDHSSTAIEPQV